MKNGIRILGIGMSLILASSCCVVSQGAELEKEMDVGKYMTVRTEQKTQRMEIQKEKFTEMKQEAEHKGVSDLQLSKQILQGIGLQSDGLIAQQLANLMEKSESITCGVQYLQINENGEAEVLSKEDCLKKIEIEEKAENAQNARLRSFQESSRQAVPQLKANGDITSGDLTSSNQYMEMALIAADQSTKASPGEYLIFGIAHWLKTPVTRKEDGLSLGINYFSWTSKTDQNLEDMQSMLEYQRVFDSRTTGIHQVTTRTQYMNGRNAQLGNEGFYFTWDLPNDYWGANETIQCSDFAFTIAGVGNVLNADKRNPFSVTLRYIHTQYKLAGNIEFAWASGSYPGISASGGIIADTKSYDMRIQVWHNPS